MHYWDEAGIKWWWWWWTKSKLWKHNSVAELISKINEPKIISLANILWFCGVELLCFVCLWLFNQLLLIMMMMLINKKFDKNHAKRPEAVSTPNVAYVIHATTRLVLCAEPNGDITAFVGGPAQQRFRLNRSESQNSLPSCPTKKFSPPV